MVFLLEICKHELAFFKVYGLVSIYSAFVFSCSIRWPGESSRVHFRHKPGPVLELKSSLLGFGGSHCIAWVLGLMVSMSGQFSPKSSPKTTKIHVFLFLKNWSGLGRFPISNCVHNVGPMKTWESKCLDKIYLYCQQLDGQKQSSGWKSLYFRRPVHLVTSLNAKNSEIVGLFSEHIHSSDYNLTLLYS